MKTKPFKGSGHLVLAGNSPFLPIILEELARSGLPDKTTVVLCSELSITPAQRKLFPAAMVHFQEMPSREETLAAGSPASARAVIVATYGEPDADRKAFDITRSLVHKFKVAPESITVPVTGDEAEHTIHTTSGTSVKTIPVHTLLARVIAQSARQKHLSEVYTELFSFHGNEFYTVPRTEAKNLTFARCLRLYANACAVGLRTNNSIRLNPPMNTIVGDSDSLVVLAPSLHAAKKNDLLLPAPDNTGISTTTLACGAFESFLFLGWNPLCADIFSELDRYVPTGSRAECITLPSMPSPLSIPLLNTLSVHHRTGNLSDPRFLASLPWEQYEHIVLPGNNNTGDGETRELRRMLETVLAERGFVNHITSVHWFPQEDPSQEPHRGTVAVSHILRMAAQELFHHEFTLVVEELTTDKGAEIYLKPAENYIALDKSADFYTILESARRKNETAIGYIQNGTVVLNPEKASRVRFYHFDKIVVLSDENC